MGAAVLGTVEAKVIRQEETDWNPHPKFKGVDIAYLLTRKDDGVDLTCAMVHWAVGAEIPRHIH